MKSRLFVVDSNTIQTTVENNLLSVRSPGFANDQTEKHLGSQWLETISDLMADVLQVEIGDYVFLWENATDATPNRIHGVYRVISRPYYSCSSPNDEFPFKIKIEPAYRFAAPVEEYELLNWPYIKEPLWNVIGKKVAGKSRGTTPISIKETQDMILLLIGKNPNYEYFPPNRENIVNVPNPLRINYANVGDNEMPLFLRDLVPNNLNYFSQNETPPNVHYEKILEAIFNQEMADRNIAFFAQLGIDATKVIWYSNYLPYSLDMKEIDYCIIESYDGINFSKIYLIEFMKTKIDAKHIKQSYQYANWLNDKLALGKSIVQPILIAYDSYDFTNNAEPLRTASATRKQSLLELMNFYREQYACKDLQVFTYSHTNEGLTFNRRR